MPATGEQTLHARLPLPDLFERGQPNTLTCPLYTAGALVAPSSGTVTIYDGAGQVVSSPAVTITGSIATASYTPPTTLSLSDRWRVEWALAVSGVTHTIRNEALLVRRRLYCPISEVDLYRRASSLDPAGGSPITVKDDFSDYINEAWNQIQHRLMTAGNRPNLVVGPSALRLCAVELSLALIFEDLATRLNPAFAESAAMHRAEWAAEWGRVQLTYDTDDSGTSATSNKRAAKPSYVWLT